MKIKIMSKIKLVILLIVGIQNLGNSCSCGIYEPVFCRIVTEGHNIIQVVVTDSTSHIMKVNLIENINKEINEDSLLIYGQDGWTCGESLNQFNINDTLILAVTEWEFNGVDYWYLEGYCGVHFLRYEEGMVKGQITDTLTLQPIQDFKDNLFSCLDMEVPIEDVENLENQITVFPNPVLENFQISITQNQIDGYKIYNLNGQQIKNRTYYQSENTVEVNSNGMESGIYYIRIITSKGILTRKILKI